MSLNRGTVRKWTALIVVLALVMMSLTLFPVSAVQSAVGKTKLILQWTPQSQFAGYYIALEKGFYKKHGLDVEILRGGPDRDPVKSLAIGEAQFATTWLTTALAERENGVPLVNLAQVVNQSNQIIIARKDAGINQVQDLNGKKISVWEGGFRPIFTGFFKKHNLEPLLLPQNYSVNLFLLKGVDACVAMYYNEYNMIYLSGVNEDELKTFFLRDYDFGFPEDGIYSLEKTLEENPELCKAFVEASLEGWLYAQKHPEESLDIIMRYVQEAHVPTNRPHMKWMLEKILSSVIPSADDSWKLGELSRENYLKTVSMAQKQGLIKAAPSYEEFCRVVK